MNYKKLIIILSCTMLTILLFASCKKQNDPPAVPGVTTTAVTVTGPNSATAGGNITNGGSSEVTASGVVYSSAASLPTLADTKVETERENGAFTVELENLTSGTTFYVRAFATNSVGTAYGEAIQFVTGNAAPIATNLLIEGEAKVGQQLKATYTYSDSDNDAESGTMFQWYIADDGTGAGEMAIDGGTDSNYIVQDEDAAKYIRVGVKPKAATGSRTGIEVKSDFTAGVGDETEVTFMYNGVQVTYGIIVSDTTGRKWLDRNLGAANTPTAYDNWQNYGDLFQWGRGADGHQFIARTGNTNEQCTAVNGTTDVLAGSDNPGHTKFITSVTAPFFSWQISMNRNLWQGVNGINNPCPNGWRIPTFEEWQNENINSIQEGFQQLKLTLGGQRIFPDGSFDSVDYFGKYWSSFVSSDPNSGNAGNLEVGIDYSLIANSFPANGHCVRCVKD